MVPSAYADAKSRFVTGTRVHHDTRQHIRPSTQQNSSHVLVQPYRSPDHTHTIPLTSHGKDQSTRSICNQYTRYSCQLRNGNNSLPIPHSISNSRRPPYLIRQRTLKPHGARHPFRPRRAVTFACGTPSDSMPPALKLSSLTVQTVPIARD